MPVIPPPPDKRWVHGRFLGRYHADLRRHLAEDHGVHPWRSRQLTSGGSHGLHDRLHSETWAFAKDLPHDKNSQVPDPWLRN